MSSRLGRACAGTFGTSVVIALGGLVTGVLLARYLGPDDRGALAAVLLWPNLLVGIGLLSLNEALIFARQQQSQSNPEHRFNASVVALAIVLALATLSLGVPLVPLLLSGREPELVALAVVCLLLIVPARFLGLSISGIDRANLHFGRQAIGGLITDPRTTRRMARAAYVAFQRSQNKATSLLVVSAGARVEHLRTTDVAATSDAADGSKAVLTGAWK